MRNNFLSLGLFAFFFVGGFFAIYEFGGVYEISRDPAAVRNTYDFTHLKGEELETAVKKRLLAGFELKRGPEGTSIGLGHFAYLEPESGAKKLACQEFKTVTLQFEAEGVMVSGESAIMEVQGHCDLSSDLAKIDPLLIPVQKILADRPADGDYEFGKDSQDPVLVRFKNLPEAWPSKWILKSVKLMNPEKSEALFVESDEIAQLIGHPIVFSWQ